VVLLALLTEVPSEFVLICGERIRSERRVQNLTRCRGISFVLSSIVFHVIPTALEITMVCGILVSRFHPRLAGVDTLIVLEIRMGFRGCDCRHHGSLHLVHRSDDCLAVSPSSIHRHTPVIPEPCTDESRTKFRKDANAADNKGATVAVDSLINYEAVKVGYDPRC
jgi:ATP-binding cassette subfamily B (MDR/TAP) protein 7